MLVIGVDLAAEPPKTALALMQWTPGRAVVRDLVIGVDDEMLIGALTAIQKAGIDCPFG